MSEPIRKDELQEVYHLLFESAAEGLIVVDKKGAIVLCNRRAGDLFGYNTEALEGVNVDHLLPLDKQQMHAAHRKEYMERPRARSMGLGLNLEARRKDGTRFPVEVSLNHFRFRGMLYVMALVTDVSRRKEAEDRLQEMNNSLEELVHARTRQLEQSQELYRLIARNFPNGTINVFDQHFNYLFAEGKELYKLGITSRELIGTNYVEWLPDNVKEDIRRELRRALRGENVQFEIEHNHNVYSMHAVGIPGGNGEMNRVLLVEHNISDQKEAEKKILESLRKQRELNEMKTRFVSMASHEFRTPLSTIVSSAQLLGRHIDADGPKEKQKQHVQRILSSANNLNSILQDFLSVDRLEMGKPEPRFQLVVVRDLVEEVGAELHSQLKPGQQVQMALDNSLEMVTDPAMLRNILTNLAGNAIKYSPESSTVTIKAEPGNGGINFCVTDEGMGMSETEVQHAFERFYRARSVANLPGTGLGLYIVHRYVELLGGSVEIHSRQGEGTQIHFSIPHQDEYPNSDY